MNEVIQPRGKALRDAVLALSLANLCLINPWFAVLFDVDFGYFNHDRVTSATLLALLSNTVALALVFWSGARLLRWLESPLALLAGRVGTVGLLIFPLDFFRIAVLDMPDRHVLGIVKQPWQIAVVLLVLIAVVRWNRGAFRLAQATLLILFPLVLFTFGKSGALLLHVRELVQHEEAELAAPPLFERPRPNRVVWIIFDELDQRVAFAERPSWLKLPEFDRLCAEALCASNAYPPGGGTAVSMPALLTGRPVASCTPISASDLLLTLHPTNETVRWSQLPNIFARARQMGYNTALASWCHPYSRILGRSLNFCEWYPLSQFESGRGRTFWTSARQQLSSTVPILDRRFLQVEYYSRLLDHALALGPDRRYGLVHIHLPVPHKPCIYDPETGRVAVVATPFPQGYLFNLQLADRTLGQVRQRMEQAGAWDKSWVLVTSDHWWRDAATLDGKQDRRIPFLLKAPGPAAPQRYSTEFDTLVTHDLILAILRGDLSTTAEAAHWLDAHKPLAIPMRDHAPPPTGLD
ncbi:MAG: sulfatase-like hydrolase/transferase [Verrucomicrobia bacterium]|nr:sulfatase-like hydrolase/transferase [Verrucomicrobiota bacterium]